MSKPKNKSLKLILILIPSVGIFLIIAYVIWLLFSPLKNNAGASFVVEPGQSTAQIAQNLQNQNYIKSAKIFLYYAKIKKGIIQAGAFKFPSSNNLAQIYQALTGGETSERYATIPEGWRLTQIDEYFAAKKIISKGALLKIGSTQEGYFFPDSYRFLPDTDPATVKKEMLDNFQVRTKGLNVTAENLIIASIVEREAKFDEDRAKIAGVYYNRLKIGMRLEADPTIQYAKGSWDPIKVSDYHSVDSAYNTYLHDGLPPGPICNPGLKSIVAAVRPDTSNNYLYFLHKADGHAVYATTLAEHEANIAKYR